MEIRDFLLLVHLSTGASPTIARRVMRLLAEGKEPEISTLKEAVGAKNQLKLARFIDDGEQMATWRRLAGKQFLCCTDAEYPERLRNMDQPPLVLFWEGDLNLLKRCGLAVVGARAAGDYTQTALNKLLPHLAPDVCIISGLAKGADACAHRCALACGLAPIAVIATGLDQVYPYANAGLQKQIVEKGLLISEYPSGTKALPYRFIARNRIIAGLAHGLLVTEAAHHSGSLITATMALDAGRNVFALPNRIDAPLGIGTNEIIQNGAAVALSGADINAELKYFA
ncbi:DNA-processing protein DprA [Lacticaseibacillus zhaodongensis]|uniref:DNA-processing protein DprA n=1 Tax=Lacticaseibacillus zhaodongensis TaxID=2668065 RepID=UPI0012D2EC76|nr:DNA-processing protein DprA [Lacticaseibacillus zhaodongensis]